MKSILFLMAVAPFSNGMINVFDRKSELSKWEQSGQQPTILSRLLSKFDQVWSEISMISRHLDFAPAYKVKKEWKINTRDKKLLPFDSEKERLWQGPFYFIQGADTQFGFISRSNNDSVVTWEDEVARSKAIVKRINLMEPPPKFFIICGDMVDADQGSPARDPQELSFREIFGGVRPDVPLLCICGNHDVGDHPTPTTIQSYRDRFGDDYYSFFAGGVFFIALNSQYFFDPSTAPIEAKEHTRWILQTLKTAKDNGVERIVIFQHIPWFLNHFNEPDDYYNLNFTVRQEWMPIFKAANVEAIFCGHYHRNSEGIYEDIPVIVTSAIGKHLGDEVSGARVVSILENSIEHKYYAIEDLPLDNSL